MKRAFAGIMAAAVLAGLLSLPQVSAQEQSEQETAAPSTEPIVEEVVLPAEPPADDSDFVAAAGADHAYTVGTSAYDASFPHNLSSGEVRITWGDHSVRFGLPDSSDTAEVSLAGDALTYSDVYPGVDIRYTILPLEVKEDIVFHNEESLRSRVDFSMSLSGQLDADLAAGGEIDLDDNGRPSAELEAPYVADSSGTRAPEGLVGYGAGPLPDGVAVKLDTEASWLTSPERQWPLIVDPTTTIKPTETDPSSRDCWIASDSEKDDNNCHDNYLRAGIASSGNKRRSLLRFSLADIPTDASIVSAQLELYLHAAETRNPGNISTSYKVHEVTKPWTYAVTWRSSDGTGNTGTNWWGGIYEPAWAVATKELKGDTSGYKGLNVTHIMKGWQEDRSTNEGVLVRQGGDDGSSPPQHQVAFWSATAEEWRRPRLVVDYTLTPPSVPDQLSPSETFETNDTTPELSARYSDPTGRPGWLEFELGDSSGTLTSGKIGSLDSPIASGTAGSWSSPNDLPRDGSYWWRARACTRHASNCTDTAQRSLVLDTTAPAFPTLTSTPEDGADPSPSWSFEMSAGHTYECSLVDEENVVRARQSCTSPVGYDLASEADGTYGIRIFQIDGAGNSSEVEGTEVTLDRPCTSVTLETNPTETTAEVEMTTSVHATVNDVCHGSVVQGAAIEYQVSGVNSSSGTLQTDENGDAYLIYASQNAGDDDITFTASSSGGPVSATSVVHWQGTPLPFTNDPCQQVPLDARGHILPTSCDREIAENPLPTWEVATSGPCAGLYEIAPGRCSHGVDPAPPETPLNPEVAMGMASLSTATFDAENEPSYDEGSDPDYLASVASSDDSGTSPTAISTEAAEIAAADQEDSLCAGDGVSGFRVQAVYAIGKDQASRYKRTKSVLREYAHRASRTFYQSSAQKYRRKIRFVCTSQGKIAIRKLVVPADKDQSLYKLLNWLNTTSNPPTGMRKKDRKYMIWVDRVGSGKDYCGIGETTSDPRKNKNGIRNAAEWGYYPGYEDAQKWGTPPSYGATFMIGLCSGNGFGDSWHNTEAHELVHNLGGVNPRAPHGTVGHHCWDEYDALCYDDHKENDGVVKTLDGTHKIVEKCVSNDPDDPAKGKEKKLDCRRNDYFNSRRQVTGYLDRKWNVADSRFLLGRR